jgi:hypothetical protein
MDILTGNELISGAAVYLDRDGNWVEDLQRARLFAREDAEALEAAKARTRATLRINSIEVETVKVENGVLVPDRLRERIRADGPTTPRFDRQHLGEDGHVSI